MVYYKNHLNIHFLRNMENLNKKNFIIKIYY